MQHIGCQPSLNLTEEGEGEGEGEHTCSFVIAALPTI